MNNDWQEPVDTTVKAAPFKKIIKVWTVIPEESKIVFADTNEIKICLISVCVVTFCWTIVYWCFIHITTIKAWKVVSNIQCCLLISIPSSHYCTCRSKIEFSKNAHISYRYCIDRVIYLFLVCLTRQVKYWPLKVKSHQVCEMHQEQNFCICCKQWSITCTEDDSF